MEHIIDPDNLDAVANKLESDEIVGLFKVLVELKASAAGSEAFKLLRNMEKLLAGKQLSAEKAKIYKEFILELKYASFLRLETREQQQLIRNNLFFALNRELDLKGLLQQAMYPLDQFDKEKQATLLKAFESNNEVLGTSPIVIEGMGESVAVAGNWIKDYNFRVPAGIKHDALQRLNYLNNSSNIKQLTKEAKERLKDVLELYDGLKYPTVEQTQTTKVPVKKSTGQAVTGLSKQSTTRRPQVRPGERPTAPPANPFDLSAVSGGPHQLEDILERAALRAEAGLPIDEDEVQHIMELIKRKKTKMR